MPGGTERSDIEFVVALRILWASSATKEIIADELTARGWRVDEKSVDYYRKKYGLPARRITRYSNSRHTTSALTDSERAFFFAGLDRIE